jgi:hypothetical protein
MSHPIKPLFNRIKSVEHRNGSTVYSLEYDTEMFKQAACSGTDTEFFFPQKEIFSREDMQIYERICGTCPILNACREWAIVHERYGVWGNTTPMQRHEMRKRLGWAHNDPIAKADRGLDYALYRK